MPFGTHSHVTQLTYMSQVSDASSGVCCVGTVTCVIIIIIISVSYGCGPNSCSISRAISMLFCEMCSALIANIWSNPSPTSCSSCRSVSTPHRAKFSLFASWLSRSRRCGGGDDDTLTSCELLLLVMQDLSSACTAVDGFPLSHNITCMLYIILLTLLCSLLFAHSICVPHSARIGRTCLCKWWNRPDLEQMTSLNDNSSASLVQTRAYWRSTELRQLQPTQSTVGRHLNHQQNTSAVSQLGLELGPCWEVHTRLLCHS